MITPAVLKEELDRPGRSQSALARHMKMPASVVNRMANGTRDIKAREVPAIQAYLDATPPSTPTLVERIKERLCATGKTARGASLESGFGPDMIRTIFDGRSAHPRYDTITALARVLDCDAAYLMGETTELRDAGPEPGPTAYRALASENATLRAELAMVKDRLNKLLGDLS